MIAATEPIQRPIDARLLVVDAEGHIGHRQRVTFVELLRVGDVVIANDAATLPASLQAIHKPTGLPIEVRLAGRLSLKAEDVKRFSAIVFGEGDYHTRTEDRKAPPTLAPGDQLIIGSLCAIVERNLNHPRFIELLFAGRPDQIWAGLARHGHPIQYAHLPTPLALWDVWTKIAGPPAAFEPPSAGFVLDWHLVAAMRARGVEFETLTHAAGISSTGDEELDRLLPFAEAYRIPEATAGAIRRAKRDRRRVIAVGTSVVRALEAAGAKDGTVVAGDGIATGRIGPGTALRVADAILSGTHEPNTSHYELLRAFTDDETLRRTSSELDQLNYRTHEFGDSVFIERRLTSPGRVRPCYWRAELIPSGCR